MGKNYVARFEDGTRRVVAGPSNGHAKLFYELTCLIEREFVPLPSGIADDAGLDEHMVNPEQFVPFFEAFWKVGWLGERRGLLYAWAQEAAGMIENITLTPGQWADRFGEPLEVRRYLRTEEVTQRLAERGINVPPYPKQKQSDGPA